MKTSLKIGDIVLDRKGSSWGETRFHVESIFRLGRLTMLWCKEINNRHCNLIASGVRIIDSRKRPLYHVERNALMRMVKKGVVEAQREFAMRVNSKTLKR